MTADGHGLGAMCVLGAEPRQVTDEERAILRDLAAMVMAQIELRHAFGRLDPVSGLQNCAQFIDDLEDLARDRPSERRCAVLIELMGFAQLTAAMRVIGPSFVDDVVGGATRGLRAVLGPGVTIYQIGSIHVAYLLGDMSEPELLTSIDAVRGGIGFIVLGQAPISLKPAVGLAPFNLGEAAPRDVLRAAQSAMQDARDVDAGVGIYSPTLDAAHRRRFRLLSDFPAALAPVDQLSLHYQPRIDARSGAVVGAEALLRWTHPTLGNVPPGEFIPIIEQTALSRETTEWVLRAALAQIAAWRRRSIWITVSVNLSASNLDGPDLAVRLARMLREFGIPADVLELELTEGAVIREGHLAVDQLKEITASGVRLAIDDFGTGYSSLSYLERIPAQVVKIDRSFMHKLDVAEGKGTLVGGMVSLLHQLGYRVVAEGVETQATLDALLALGCDEIQGYLISRPLAAEAFQEWYAEQPVAGSAKDERSHAQQSPTSCRPRAAP